MFHEGLLIFIIMLVFDILSKSLSDKRKIEKSRKKAQNWPNKSIDIEKSSYGDVRKGKDIPAGSNLHTKEVKAEPLGSQLQKDNMSYVKNEVKDAIAENAKRKDNIESLNRKKNSMKNDILKGIIYSEILGEPKSIRIKRSI